MAHDMKRVVNKLNKVFFLAGLLTVVNPMTAYAATINLSPSNGSFPAFIQEPP